MTYDCKMLADSIAPNGVRLCTMQATFPRFILPEANTHRDFSRNSASSRAMPVLGRVVDGNYVEGRVDVIRRDPFVPAEFAQNQKGMQAGEAFDAEENELIRQRWLALAAHLADEAEWFARRKVHKQWANRVIELPAWHTAIITATAWENWDNLRDNPQASPEIQVLARMMKQCRAAAIPTPRRVGEWHLPLVYGGDVDGADVHFRADEEMLPIEKQVKLSVARCARVSYLTHDGKRDVDADLALYDRLVSSGHMSPLEHAVKVASDEEIEQYALFKCTGTDDEGQVHVNSFKPVRIGNLAVPWLQHRKMIAGEDVFQPKQE